MVATCPQTLSDPASSKHQVQGPRKGFGPSCQRRRERRAAKRATVTEEASSENVSAEDETEKVYDATEKGNYVGAEKVPSVKASRKWNEC